MSLVPWGDKPDSLGIDLVNTLIYHADYIYYWLRDIAPVLIKYQLKQLGRDGIDNLPFLTPEIKAEVERWLKTFSIL